MKMKLSKKSMYLSFFFCLAIRPIVPYVQAESQSVDVRPVAGGYDPRENSNMSPLMAKYVDPVRGTGVEELIQMALTRNADLLAARQRINEAQGLLLQAGFRPNPGFEVSVTNGSILGRLGGAGVDARLRPYV